MATAPSTGNTAASALPAAGGTSESTLSSWAGPYVTNMLGKAQAVANEPYQVYQGPMTAGQSNLQSKVFQGLGNLSFPGNLGQSFSSGMGGNTNNYGGPGGPAVMPQQGGTLTPYSGGRPTDVTGGDYTGGKGFNPATMQSNLSGAPTATGAMPNLTQQQTDSALNASYTGQTNAPQGIAGLQAPQASMQPSNIAQSYMNPYLQSVLDPQMAELRRQNDITNMKANAGLTQAGAFGGGRQAIMNAENNRNLMMEQNKTVGQGYANAYDKAMGQFNTEQGQARDLANLMSTQGAQQRDIEQQGISADYNEFLAQRDYPMKQTQYLQSMLQGLPISTVSNQAAQQSGIGQLSSTVGGLGNIMESLKKLGL